MADRRMHAGPGAARRVRFIGIPGKKPWALVAW